MSLPATGSEGAAVPPLRQRYAPWLTRLRSSETAKASWLAGAMMANNVIALGSTVVFARVLGANYGSLAALVSYFLILAVAGYAMQVATAREAVLGHLGVGPALAATVRSWTKSILIFTVAISALSALFRHPIADAVGVKYDAWAAAVGLPAGCLYLLLTVYRGVLQGTGDYRRVGISLIGEQTARLIIGTVLALAGLGVTGAYLGTPLSFLAMCLYCMAVIRKDVGLPVPGKGAALSLSLHIKRAWAPIAALAVIAVLQNIDIIAAKHRFSRDLASSYSATAVAAKVVIWVAMGAGFYLVPEVSRRRAAGEDPRPVLARALAIIAVVAIPCLLIFAVAPHLLLELAFGKGRATAYDSLFILGLAFTVLAATYLAIQYMLALKRFWFLVVLAAVAVAEPVLLLNASQKAAGFAAVVLAVQVAGALLAFGIALRRSGPPLDRAAVAEGPPDTAMGAELV
ncbi:MAG: polysaccharide biosynthesis C-terminal domain-containing protein [Actinomycetota bacterium]|nr:polysaccharide biosynthesis C-terminal domain-containing protein [Actinomycetota bacterium]